MPGLIEGIALMQQSGREFPGFQRFLRRARHSIINEENDALKFKLLTAEVPKELPIAFLSAVADGLENHDGWIRADPVGLNVDLVHIYMSGRRHLSVTADEANILTALISPLLKEFNFSLRIMANERGYLNCGVSPDIQTVSPDAIIGKSIIDYLPHGPDDKFWRRLLTEIQMVLQDCEVNKKRASKGQPTIDALWFWGQGSYQQQSIDPRFKVIFTDDEVIIGLCKLLKLKYKRFNGSIPGCLDYCAKNKGKYLIASNHLLNHMHEKSEFLGALQKFFPPVLRALAEKKITSLELYVGDKHCYHISTREFRLWWNPWSRK